MCPLWIVSTPIGNLSDLSPRAREILTNSDLILAEDTRRTGQLLALCQIHAKKLISFHDHNEAERQPQLLDLLAQGYNIALVSDAGTPLLADPGYRLVRACHAQGILVSPVPGPSAPVAALSAAGLPPLPFSFLGFLPRSEGAIRELFTAYAHVPGSLIFFERKDRLQGSLKAAYECLGSRELAICRELTKIHEEFIIARLEKGPDLTKDLLGELTIIIGPPEKPTRLSEQKAKEIVLEYLRQNLKPRKAALAAVHKCAGWSASELYDLAVKSCS